VIIYAAIGAFGLLFLLIMLFVGDLFGGDHEFHVDHDASMDHADVSEGGGPSIFSARIMASFLTAFGVGGVVARYYDLSHPAASGVGIVAGIVLSALVYQFARILYGQQASSEVRMTSLVGQAAEVTVGIPAGGVGQVTLTFGGERTMQIARSSESRPIPPGTEVKITGLLGDSVVVERVKGPEAGGAR
jgi:membrane protein implicated in regulation of membrane protease activity